MVVHSFPGVDRVNGVSAFIGHITNKMAHELHELTRIFEKKEANITITKGSHGKKNDNRRL